MSEQIEISVHFSEYDIRFQKDNFSIVWVSTCEKDKVPANAIKKSSRKGEVTFIAKGYFKPNANVGYLLTGEFKTDFKYGVQFQIVSYKVIPPTDKKRIINFLVQVINGCGKITAEKLYNTFGEKVFEVMENSPERLYEVKSLRKGRINKIISSYNEQKMLPEIRQFLPEEIPWGNDIVKITLTDCLKIYKKFGNNSMKVIQQNPYFLFAVDFPFTKVDSIASLSENQNFANEERIAGAITEILKQNSRMGNLYMPQKECCGAAVKLLNEHNFSPNKVIMKDVVTEFCKMAKRNDINGDNGNVYLSDNYEAEIETAKILASRVKLSAKEKGALDKTKVYQIIKEESKLIGFLPSEEQSKAAYMAIDNSILILTGGPGTGKTSTLKLILKTLQKCLSYSNEDILLLAPTGRAKQRISETVGKDYESKTIHSALKLRVAENDFDEEDMIVSTANSSDSSILEKKVIVVDEASMMGQKLFYSLLQKVGYDSRLIIVGDENQLPSIEAGNVLSELIKSNCIAFQRLTKIFRQAEESLIVTNAHRILNGDCNLIYGDDFKLIEINQPDDVSSYICNMYANSSDKDNLVILSPVRKKGSCGTRQLNVAIQQMVNTSSKSVRKNGIDFKENDRVIQTMNCKYYDENDNLIYISNGDTGVIKNIDGDNITIRFQEDTVVYHSIDLDNLDLSYAITIHKSQGSEYPTVIIPLLNNKQFTFALQRNLLYTAVTRGKQKVIIVGETKAIEKAIISNAAINRKTMLAQRIIGFCGNSAPFQLSLC